jgi:aspartyl-tRNA(Asn)/glutamyl-tRNA(Gln) amidotransferase subunit A
VTDPADLTVLELLPLLASRELSSREVVQACLARIDALEPQVRAFVTRTDEAALSTAAAVDQARSRGDALGPLAGVPLGLKDLYETAGVRTAAGSGPGGPLEHHVPTTDATVWTRLRDAGCVLLGKLTTHEFAYGTSTPPTGNPWDLTRTPGGSSGGSAAALAARMLPLATGSDTIGSLRLPASVCGTASMRPTYGRSSRAGVIALSWSLDTTGVMARRLGDIAYATRVIAGRDPRDPSTADVPVPDYPLEAAPDLRGRRLGVPTSFYWDDLDPGVEAVCRAALDTLRELGATLVDVPVPEGNAEWDEAPLTVLLAESASYHATLPPGTVSAQVRAFLDLGASLPATAYLDAQRMRGRSVRAWSAVFADLQLDAVVCPTAIAPPGARGTSNDEVGEQVSLRNITTWSTNGFPSITVPAGLDPSGLPVGLMLGGPPFTEDVLLGLGLAYEAAVPFWRDARPALVAP